MDFRQNITPLILTRNEAPNIARTMAKLAWASDVVVVDSLSDDDTLEILRRFRQVRVFQREFDSHAKQWNYGLKETGIRTAWVLALDADYVLSDSLVEELAQLDPGDQVSAYEANFRYLVFGRPLRGSLYPPVNVLFRRDTAQYVQDGHTQRVAVNGEVEHLKSWIFHDDRKPLSSWLLSQDRYMKLEAEHIAEQGWGELGAADRIRRLIWVSPFLVFAYSLLVKRTLLDGRAGLYYALQRMLAECLLALRLLEATVARRHGDRGPPH
jgi:glycosyltransferase involved in cell wall biosynthesis